MPKLFIAYLGGPMSKERIGEDHETVFCIAENREEAKQKARLKWKGYGAGHLDMLIELNTVDGYDIVLQKSSAQESMNMDSDWDELNA